MITRFRPQVEQLPPCPACNNRDFKKLFVKMERHFWRCTNCQLELQHPLPKLEELRDYYQDAYLSGMYKPFVEAKALKAHTAQQRFNLIRAYCRPGRWLDIGASTGVFVACAQQAGIEAEGIDFTPAAVQAAQEHGLPVHCATIEAYDPPYRFDTITAFDILEHVVDPRAFLESLRNLLTPGGTFAIAIPNQASMYRKILGKRWFYYIPGEHL